MTTTTTTTQVPKSSFTGTHNILIMLTAASAFMTLVSIFGPTLYLVEHQQHHRSDAAFHDLLLRDNDNNNNRQRQRQRQPPAEQEQAADAAPADDDEEQDEDGSSTFVEVRDLPHEHLFRATIKSCVPATDGTTKCKQYVPDPVPVAGDNSNTIKKKVQRVAVLAPPGEMISPVLNVAELVQYQHNRQRRAAELEIDVVATTHVPPYGYGKTHGYTKLIRVVPQPVMLQVTDALQAVLAAGETHTVITVADVKTALRQVLRYHCRLSHVAAHTALLSINFMDWLLDPGNQVDSIRDFLAPTQQQRQKRKAEEKKDPTDKDSGEEGEGEEDDNNEAEGYDDLVADDNAVADFMDDDQEGLFNAEESYGTQILSNLQNQLAGKKQHITEILDAVLLDELDKTKNMTVWPCPSFWSAAADDDETNPTDLSPLTRRIAAALSPDCENDPHATCFVPRDKCEAAGDGICKGNKRR